MKKKFPEIIKDIDLNSEEWCDIIFKGKNRRYGAYNLRRNSSLRHVRAMAIMLISIFVMLIVPVIATTDDDPVENKERMVVVEFGLEINKPEKEQQIELMDPVYVNASMMTMVAVELVSNIEYIEVDQTPKSATEELQEDGGGGKGDDNGFNASLKDSKGTDAESIYAEVERINRAMAEGQADYARQIQELETGRGGKSGGKGSDGGTKGNGKGRGAGEGKGGGASSEKGNKREVVRGDVFVSYNLENRSDTFLYIPAYTCQYGGVVVINITVNRSGKVISATVDKTTSTSDDCIMKMAVQSALASSFNSSSSAPEKQKGTITYRFAAQ